MARDQPMPATAAVLGYAGLIPFAATALAVAVGLATATMTLAFTAYAATILAFLGGIQWGLAFHLDGAFRAEHAIVGVAPSLVAWVALLLSPPVALVVLALGFAGIHGYDELRNMPPLPHWYGRLRRHLTTGVLLCHGGMLATLAW